MKIVNKKIIKSLLIAVCLFSNTPLFCYPCCDSNEKTTFEGNATIKAFVESTRKDYFDAVYSFNNPVPVYQRKQYDKSFYGTDSDLNLALKTDFSEVSFFDIRESLYIRHYNREDPRSLDYSSNKFNEIDHNLRLTFGVAAGTYDYFQLDYINNIYDGGVIDSLNYRSNKGRALFAHDFENRTCLAFTGSYEEREYGIDKVLDYREARAGLEVSTLLSEKNEYVQIANSSRGEKSTFEKVPNGMSTRNAIDYYTTYVKNPRDEDPDAKYVLNQTRGELYIRGFGEMAQRDRTRLDIECDEVVGGFETIYRADKNTRVRLNEVYTDQDFDRESYVNFIHDGYSNYTALTVDYDCYENFSQSLTYSYEFYKYKKAFDENNKANSVTYDCFYRGKSYRTSMVLGYVKREYYIADVLKPDETERRAAVCFDYDIIRDLTFKFKAEYADLDYHDFEDEIFSNYKRKTWRIALEKGLGECLSFETAFQSNQEKHDLYGQNNIEEKTVGISLIGKF
jgi:hypothetical protein